MVKSCKLGRNERMSFSKHEEVLEMPDLIEIQKKSFKEFIEKGIKEVLEDVSPMVDYSGNLIIEFYDYSLSDTPRFSVEECKERDVDYSVRFTVKARLINKATGNIINQNEIFMGNFPMMTDGGTFIINGAERVIVSQIVRSPGAYYESTSDKNGKELFFFYYHPLQRRMA